MTGIDRMTMSIHYRDPEGIYDGIARRKITQDRKTWVPDPA